MAICADSNSNMNDCELHKESEMSFCPLFNSKNIESIYIEKDALYKCLGDGVDSVEFLSLKGNNLHFIEAKGTIPRKTEIKKPARMYKERELKPYNEANLDTYFEDWTCDELKQYTKWKIKHEKLEKFSQELYDKMNHSLNLIAAKELEIEKHTSQSIPKWLKESLSQKKIFFVLIVNEVLDKENPEYKEKVANYLGMKAKLDSKFQALKEIWGIDIKVYHKAQAKKKGFIA